MRAQVGAIESATSAVVASTGARLPIDGVRITVTANAGGAISGYGIGGNTPNAHTVNIAIDPGFPGLDTLLARRYAQLLAHELHHAARWRNPGYGATLLEAMVSEGMADRFAIELLQEALPPWSRSFSDDSTALLLARARPEFDSRGYNHARWFFDADPSLPRWTGYTLGFRIVDAYISAHPGATATTLVSTPASAFRP